MGGHTYRELKDELGPKANAFQVYLNRASRKYGDITSRVNNKSNVLEKYNTNKNELTNFLDNILVKIELEGKIEILQSDARETQGVLEDLQASKQKLATVKTTVDASTNSAEKDEEKLSLTQKYYRKLQAHIESEYARENARRDYIQSRKGKMVAILFSLHCGLGLAMAGFILASGAAAGIYAALTVGLLVGIPATLLANWWVGRDSVANFLRDRARAKEFEIDVEHDAEQAKKMQLRKWVIWPVTKFICAMGGIISGYFACIMVEKFLLNKFTEVPGFAMDPVVALTVSSVIAVGTTLLCYWIFLSCAKSQVWSTRLREDFDLLFDAIGSKNIKASRGFLDGIIDRKRLLAGSEAEAKKMAEQTLIGGLLKLKIEGDLHDKTLARNTAIAIAICVPAVISGAIFAMFSVLPDLTNDLSHGLFGIAELSMNAGWASGLAHAACLIAGFSYTYMFAKCTIRCIRNFAYNKGVTASHTEDNAQTRPWYSSEHGLNWEKIKFQYGRGMNSVLNLCQSALGALVLFGHPAVIAVAGIIGFATSFVMSSMPEEAHDYNGALDRAEDKAAQNELELIEMKGADAKPTDNLLLKRDASSNRVESMYTNLWGKSAKGVREQIGETYKRSTALVA